MGKWISLLLLAAFAGPVLAMDHEHMHTLPGFDPNDSGATGRFTPGFLERLTEVPDLTTLLTVRYDRLNNFNVQLLQKLENAKIQLDFVFQSTEFRDAILNHTYSGQQTFVQNNGYSNEEIYRLMHTGLERLTMQIDHLMNLELQTYYEDSNIIGYTYRDSPMIYVNRKFYDGYTSSQITRNLTHEWLHKAGFSHDQDATPRRPYSVPYAIGKIVERLAQQVVTH